MRFLEQSFPSMRRKHPCSENDRDPRRASASSPILDDAPPQPTCLPRVAPHSSSSSSSSSSPSSSPDCVQTLSFCLLLRIRLSQNTPHTRNTHNADRVYCSLVRGSTAPRPRTPPVRAKAGGGGAPLLPFPRSSSGMFPCRSPDLRCEEDVEKRKKGKKEEGVDGGDWGPASGGWWRIRIWLLHLTRARRLTRQRKLRSERATSEKETGLRVSEGSDSELLTLRARSSVAQCQTDF